ncbi:hypothetical protein D3C75_1168630 [compost metagenome]
MVAAQWFDHRTPVGTQDQHATGGQQQCHHHAAQQGPARVLEHLLPAHVIHRQPAVFAAHAEQQAVQSRAPGRSGAAGIAGITEQQAAVAIEQ